MAWFGQEHDDHREWPHSQRRTAKPRTLAEAQRELNQKIVSHKWMTPMMLRAGEFIETGEPRYIRLVYIWDGESYWDDLFCKNACAMDYARMVARSPRNTIQSVKYAEAMKRRQAVTS